MANGTLPFLIVCNLERLLCCCCTDFITRLMSFQFKNLTPAIISFEATMFWSIFLLLIYAREFACNNVECSTIVPFDNFEMEFNAHHYPKFSVLLNVTFSVRTPVIFRVKFDDISIVGNKNESILEFSTKQLAIPFEMHITQNGSHRLNTFSGDDLHESRVVKHQIVSWLWTNKMDYITLLNNCFCINSGGLKLPSDFPRCPLNWHHFTTWNNTQVNSFYYIEFYKLKLEQRECGLEFSRLCHTRQRSGK